MKCSKCGELIKGFATECPVCGASLAENYEKLLGASPKSELNPVHTHWEDCSEGGHRGSSPDPLLPMGPVEAIRLFFVRFVDFQGRSRRSEFWWASLFVYVLEMVMAIALPELGGILTFVLFIPSMALCVRRLHDVGRSGWWYLLSAVPFGALVLLYWYCKDSDLHSNFWGESPK